MIKKILLPMRAILIVLLLIPLVSAAHPLPIDLTDDDKGMMQGIADWGYTVTNGMFFVMLLIGFCIVLFIAASRYSTDRAFGYAGITGIFGSLMLATLGLMTWWFATIFIIAGIVGVVSMILSRRL